MKCPKCDFEGEFDKKKIFPLVTSILQQIREENLSGRTSVCPKCGTGIVVPSSFPQGNFGWKGMAFAVLTALAVIAYLVYRLVQF